MHSAGQRLASGPAGLREVEAAPNGGPGSPFLPRQQPPAVAVTGPFPHHWKLWGAGAFGFLLAPQLGLLVAPATPPARSRASEVIRLVPLTTFSGRIPPKDPFSPDGNEIAYAWEGDQGDHGVDINVKQTGPLKNLFKITRDFGFNFFLLLAPDGRYIAFLHSNHNEKPGIFVMPALGGPPRKLYEFHDNPSLANPF